VLHRPDSTRGFFTHGIADAPVILNLHRRHLNTVQRYLAADSLFGEQAEKEAAIAKLSGVAQNLPLKTAERNGKNRSGESHERAAKLATEAGISNICAGLRRG
jgi:hypothetical protein